jgi:hypothetical protein
MPADDNCGQLLGCGPVGERELHQDHIPELKGIADVVFGVAPHLGECRGAGGCTAVPAGVGPAATRYPLPAVRLALAASMARTTSRPTISWPRSSK